MKAVTSNGAIVRVAFKHTITADPRKIKRRGRALTVCTITLEDPTTGALSVIGEGSARCHHTDLFTKEEGRRRAIKLATRDLHREIRGLALRAYFERNKAR